jgi:hypothetical protein
MHQEPRLPLNEHKKLVDDLLTVFTKYGTPHRHIAIEVGLPYDLFTLRTDPFDHFVANLTSISVQLEGNADDMRFANSHDLSDVDRGMVGRAERGTAR